MNKFDETLYQIRTKMMFDPIVGEKLRQQRCEQVISENAYAMTERTDNKKNTRVEKCIDTEVEERKKELEKVAEEYRMKKGLNLTAYDVKQMRIILNVYENLKYDPVKLERMGVTAKTLGEYRNKINGYLKGITDETKREAMRIILYTGVDTRSLLDFMAKSDVRKADASYQKEMSAFIDTELKHLGL